MNILFQAQTSIRKYICRNLVVNGNFDSMTNNYIGYVQTWEILNNKLVITSNSPNSYGYFSVPIKALKKYRIEFTHSGGTITNLKYSLYTIGGGGYYLQGIPYNPNSKTIIYTIAPINATQLFVMLVRDAGLGTAIFDDISITLVTN